MSECLNHAEACASVAARFPQRWLRHYVASKLRTDGVFEAAADLLGTSNEPLLDIGCGVGLLPLYLRARGFRGDVVGIDRDGRKVRQARALGISAHEQNVDSGLPEFAGNIALFDVLHYLPRDRQAALLRNIAARLTTGSMLLLRDCPADGSARYWATYVGEKFAQAISWNVGVPLQFPTRESIMAAFPSSDFACEERPMYGRSPFNNRLFVFRRVAARSAG